MEEQISYKILDKKKLLVLTDKDTHKSFFTYLDGVWDSNNKGWVIASNKEKVLKKFLSDLKLEKILSDVKSRKSQDRFHREISESDDDSNSDDDVKSSESETEIDSSILELLEKNKIEEKNKFEEDKLEFAKKHEPEKKLKKKYTSGDPMLYYKSFNSQPKNFKKINNYESSDKSSSAQSSSASSSSSSDSFPSPKTPKKRRNYNKGINNENYEDILGEMKVLSRKVIELEIENKKLKSKNK